MSDTVQVDYQALRQVAQKFEEQHQKLHRLANELTLNIQNLKRGGWMSDAANDFYRDMDNVLLPRLNRLEKALHASAVKTEEIGRVMRGGEEEATGSIKSAGGGGLAGIANTIRDMMENMGNTGAQGGIAGAIGDNNPSGGGIGGVVGESAGEAVNDIFEGSGEAPGDGSVSNASEGSIGESIGNAANQVLEPQSGGGIGGVVGAAAGGAINEALGGGAAGGASGGGSSGGGGGGGSGSPNTAGQGQVVRSVDTSTPTEAPANEVGGGTGSASAFGGAPPSDGE